MGQTAENVAMYFHKNIGDRKASAHYCVDADSTVQCVKAKDVAFAAPGANHNGIHIEMAGRAGQTEAQWNDEYSQKLLARTAIMVAKLCDIYGIPKVFLDGKAVKAGARGITGHKQVNDAFKRSTHWDPGPNFPWADFIKRVNASKTK